jgi:polyisoprenoid-binding protein YceI
MTGNLRIAPFLAFVALGLAVPAAATAAPRTFELHPTGTSRVMFESDAPIESIVGVTTATTGTLTVDLDKPASSASAEVKVDLRELKTGIDKRDADMRSSSFLDTDKHPHARFKLTRIEVKGDPRAAGGASAVAHGTLQLKGTTRTIKVPVKVGYRALDDKLKAVRINGDVLRVTGKFTVALAEYGIKVPSMLGAKLAETIEISVSLTGVASSSAARSKAAR